jgi:hypothetical protein
MEFVVLLLFIAGVTWYLWGRRYWCVGRARNSLKRIPGFTPTFYFVGHNRVATAVDGITRKIAFVDDAGRSKVYDSHEVISADILTNTISLTKTNRLSQLLSAVVWKSFFGPKGFWVGGTTGSTTTLERVSKISLRVCLRDVSCPFREVSFYCGSPISVTSARYSKYATKAEEWQARFRLLSSETEPRLSAAVGAASRLRGKRLKT